MILGPNIRYTYREYWDFFDHNIPLSDKSLAEALQLVGFEVEKVLSRFLPYTTKNNTPKWPFLIHAYLLLPIAWKILGRQMFIIGKKI